MATLDLDYYELVRMLRGTDLPLTEAGTGVLKTAVDEVLARDNAEQQSRAVLDWAFGDSCGNEAEMSRRYPQIDFESDYIIVMLGAALDHVAREFNRLMHEQRFAGRYKTREETIANLRCEGGRII